MFGSVVEDEIKRVKKADIKLAYEELLALVERGKKGDNEALEQIWTSHLLFLSKHLSKSKYVGTGRTKIEPDEALGMTWESLLKAVESYNGSFSFSYWFWNKCQTDLESEWRRRCRNHERFPILSDLYPDTPLDSWALGEGPD